MTNPNELTLREFFDAFGRRDMGAVRGLLADDVVLHFSGRSRLSGDFNKDEWFALASTVMEMTGGTLDAKVHDVTVSGEHGVVLLDMRAQRGGKTLEWKRANVYHLSEGKIREVWVHEWDQYAVDEFFS